MHMEMQADRSGHEFQAAGIVVNDLAAARAEPRPAPDARVVRRAAADRAVMAPGRGARGTDGGPGIRWDMGRQRLQVCLSNTQFRSKRSLTLVILLTRPAHRG